MNNQKRMDIEHTLLVLFNVRYEEVKEKTQEQTPAS